MLADHGVNNQTPADISSCSRVVVLRHHRWRLGSLGLGPVQEVPVRITYDSDSGFTCERLDGQPMGALPALAAKQLEVVQIELLRDVRRVRVESASYLRRNPSLHDPLIAAADSGTARHAQAEHDGASSQIEVLRDLRWREAVNTRLESNRVQAPAAAVAPPAPSADVVTPFLEDWTDAPSATETKPETKYESSVFRCGKQEATNRIARLRLRSAEGQPDAAPDGSGTALLRRRTTDVPPEPGASLES